jgi:hypothetical protein
MAHERTEGAHKAIADLIRVHGLHGVLCDLRDVLYAASHNKDLAGRHDSARWYEHIGNRVESIEREVHGGRTLPDPHGPVGAPGFGTSSEAW